MAENIEDDDKAMNCYESALGHNPYSIPALTQIASLCKRREQFQIVCSMNVNKNKTHTKNNTLGN
jgi:hypothetical protein